MPSERIENLRNLVPELRPESKDRFILAIIRELEKCEEALRSRPELSLDDVGLLIGLVKAHRSRMMASSETLAGEFEFWTRLEDKLIRAVG